MGEEEEGRDHDELTYVGCESTGSKCHFMSRFFLFVCLFLIYPWSQAFEGPSRLMPSSYEFRY